VAPILERGSRKESEIEVQITKHDEKPRKFQSRKLQTAMLGIATVPAATNKRYEPILGIETVPQR
jgi:hypothetical protein